MLQPRGMFGLKYAIAILVRIVFLRSNFKFFIRDSVEISTPLNSWKRLLEGIHLYNVNVDPYSGDLFHESPITLVISSFLIKYLGPWIEVIFVLIDILVAYLLYKTAFEYMLFLKEEEHRKLKKEEYSNESRELIINEFDSSKIPAYVVYAYLYNPYIIFNCVGQTTTIFANLSLAGLFYSLVYKKKLLCATLVAILTLQSFYLFILIVPVCLQFYNAEKRKICISQVVSLFVFQLGLLLSVCWWITGSWQFINSTYSFILNVNDLTPNIGLFWYFFTEMFDHFRLLFICALQINATVLYLFPLSLHLRNEPVFLAFILTAITVVFRSYPCLGDVGFYLSLLPMWKHLFFFMQQSFLTTCFLVITSVLGPTVWHLWIYAGSANANFFFAVTLMIATAQIFLITDLLLAHKKRSFALISGLPDYSSKSKLILD